MPVILKNNVFGFLAAPISSQDTAFTLRPTQVASFPALAEDEYFYATLSSDSGASEIVRVTARAGVLCDMVRAQEDTTALAFAAGSLVELRVTAQAIIDAINDRIAQSCDCEGPILTLLTSQPYPVEVFEFADHTTGAVLAGRHQEPAEVVLSPDALDQTTAGLTAGEFRSTLILYEYQEAVDQTTAGLAAGVFRQVLIPYDNGVEAVDQTTAGLAAGVFRQILIPYNNYPVEAVDQTTAGLVGGVHAS
jgi:hypothetical protein